MKWVRRMPVARHIRMERVFSDDEIMIFCYSTVIGVSHGGRLLLVFRLFFA